MTREIIKNNIYLTLGTADGTPWVAPVFYCADDKYNFYFISQIDSLHVRQFLKNPLIAFAIFDSHAKEGSGIGVQGSGMAKLLTLKEIPEALKWYHTDFLKYHPKTFENALKYRLFKITPDHFYILDPHAPIDKRVEVNHTSILP